jgi:hypothetical protein
MLSNVFLKIVDAAHFLLYRDLKRENKLQPSSIGYRTFQRFRNVIFGIILLALSQAFLFCQTEAINGSIRGRVVDQTNSPIAQANVTAENVQTGFSRTLETAEDGYYVLPNLPLGSYTVTVSKSGFDTQRHTGVVLDAGTEATIDAQLNVGRASTTVEVSGGAPVVEPSRTSIGRTISHQEVDNLPLTSRNPYNFILFQPGVSGHPNPELGIPRTINTNGLLDRINYQMDGMVDTEKDRYGLRLFPIADIYVDEVQTISNSFAPEFGFTSGDIYNVISGSGTNQIHGEFQYIGRPVDAVARPILLPATQPKPNLGLNDTSFNASGPLWKDKLFIFGAYEHLSRGQPSPITISPANAALIGIPANLLATPDSIEHAQFVDIRLDWQIAEKERLFLRWNYFRNQFPFNTNVGGLNALSVASDFRDRAYIGGAQLLSTFSPTVLNELRLSEPYRNERHVADPLTGTGPDISITGVANFGGSIGVGDVFDEKIPSLSDNFTVIRGAHTFKLGGSFEHILDNQLADTYTEYIFPTIPAYLSALSGVNPRSYSSFKASIGLVGAGYHSVFWDVFGQDTWQVRSNLVITYGLRYDKFQGPPASANAPFIYSQRFRTPGADFAPRLGIAWSITPKTVLRVSSGIFYEAPPTNLWFNALYNSGSPAAFVGSIPPSSPFAPAFPNTISLQPALLPATPSITAVTPNFKNAYTINSSFQIAQQLSSNDALTVGYVNTGARNQTYLRNMNLINPVSYLADGRPVFSNAINAGTRRYPQFADITLQDVGAIADYNALIVNYQHRINHGVLASASYTWSHSISDAPDANSFEQNLPIEDATNRSRDRGDSIIDRPHAFTLSSVIAPTFSIGNAFLRTLANNNELTILTVAQSGDVQNIVANQILNGDQLTSSVTRPLYVGRDTARTPNIYQLDLRYTRTLFTIFERLRPKVWAEANNVFNHPNITTINTTATVNSAGVITKPPSFAPVSTVLEGRIIQLGVRVDF